MSNRGKHTESEVAWQRQPATTVLTAETLRNAATPTAPPAAETGISLFWRVFGGTIFSVVVLILITAFQMLTNSLADLRAGIERLKEANAELVKKEEIRATVTDLRANLDRLKEATAEHVKKEEFSSKLTLMWSQVKDVIAETPALKTRAAQLEAEIKSLEQERKDLCRDLQALRERLAALEGRQGTAKPAADGKTAE
jgi:predicted  nucleic acid-binding Zn-ribbon protein